MPPLPKSIPDATRSGFAQVFAVSARGRRWFGGDGGRGGGGPHRCLAAAAAIPDAEALAWRWADPRRLQAATRARAFSGGAMATTMILGSFEFLHH